MELLLTAPFSKVISSQLFGYRQFGDKQTKHYLQQEDANYNTAQVCSIQMAV